MAKQGVARLRVALQHHNVVEPPPVRGSQVKFAVAANRLELMRLRARRIKPVVMAVYHERQTRAIEDLAEYARRTEQHVEVMRITVNEIYQIKQTRFLQGR